MGELSRAADEVVRAMMEGDGGQDALRKYGDVRIEYFLTGIEEDLGHVRAAVEEANSEVGKIVLAWVTRILDKDRDDE